ncbi:MAG: YggS family pyridoxal phosphate-dependent enzyme [Lachnospiraceae bacterium]|nr:YggS family pyridoxal phosphate-dependent enzyme [Lachnospiraceae bacterium]MBQ6258681.1 YggS family pyridoxal phosphate-dependent enzyme [Lachnospiraceae bacterium]
MLKENYSSVLEKVAAAAVRSGRDPKDVTLIAVGKMHEPKELQEVYDAGCRDFGENKVQELTGKIEVLPKDINWHLIGHLQRNKVKYIAGKTTLIHSVDSLRLAEEIEVQTNKLKNGSLVSDILLEVNASGEISKFGIRPEESIQLCREISALRHVRVRGLMTVAPYVDDPEKNRSIFRKIRTISLDIRNANIDNVSMDILSMGMSGDYEVAIEEGATMVRVGTSIFGARDYSSQSSG